MDRRLALKALAGLALCPLCAPAGFAAEHAHWGYEGEVGPAHWGDIDAASKVCSIGSQQSPIDINGAIKSELYDLEIKWADSAATIVNNGHTIQLNFAEGSTLIRGDSKYKLLQVHFHRPSEHTINGKNFPMEAHFVHRADNGALAVLGVLIAGEGSNEAFSKIVATMPTHEGPAVEADPSINLKELLPSKLGYYRYEGSLTTPPCTEIVDWLVLVDHVTVASNDVVAFAKLYPNNARPVQTDNRRFVLRSN